MRGRRPREAPPPKRAKTSSEPAPPPGASARASAPPAAAASAPPAAAAATPPAAAASAPTRGGGGKTALRAGASYTDKSNILGLGWTRKDRVLGKRVRVWWDEDRARGTTAPCATPTP